MPRGKSRGGKSRAGKSRAGKSRAGKRGGKSRAGKRGGKSRTGRKSRSVFAGDGISDFFTNVSNWFRRSKARVVRKTKRKLGIKTGYAKKEHDMNKKTDALLKELHGLTNNRFAHRFQRKNVNVTVYDTSQHEEMEKVIKAMKLLPGPMRDMAMAKMLRAMGI